MNKIARRFLILGLFILSIMPVFLLSPYYSGVYIILEKYHVEGIGVCWLGSYVIANLCAPWFMQSGGPSNNHENGGAIEITKLYFGVMLITFTALAIVTVVLWCIGWLLILITLPLYWFKEWLEEILL